MTMSCKSSFDFAQDVESLSSRDGREGGDRVTFGDGGIQVHAQTVKDDHAGVVERHVKAGDGLGHSRPARDFEFDGASRGSRGQQFLVIGEKSNGNPHGTILAQARNMSQ